MCFFLILVGCRSAREFTMSPSPAIEETGVQLLSSPTSTVTIALPTTTPSVRYQLTFTSVQRVGYSQQMYAIEVGCLTEEIPCFGEPELLFEVPWPGRVGLPIFSFDWSPDGRRVVWEDGLINERGDIVVADWNGQNRINLSRSPGPDGFPDWSADGTKIIFTTKIDPYKIVLMVVTPDGKESAEFLTKSIEVKDPAMASFSPDGKQVVFQDYRVEGPFEGLYQIFLANLDGTKLIQLTSALTNHYYPSFSPDGNWVVFSREMDPNEPDTHIFLIWSDGSDEVSLTENMPGTQSKPAWAPFGGWIAFIATVEGVDSLYLIKADGSQLMQVSQDIGDIGYIAWRTVFEP
jgi:Tol biopolymer transport system component